MKYDLSVVNSICISNSPHPSSWMRKGGFLKTVLNVQSAKAGRPESAGERAKHTLGGTRPKTRVQVVGHLVKESGRHLLSFVIDKEDLDRPGPLREAFHLRWLITKVEKQQSACAQPNHLTSEGLEAVDRKRLGGVCRSLLSSAGVRWLCAKCEPGTINRTR